MQEENQSPGNAVENNIIPCRFKVGDWVKMNAASKGQRRFSFMEKDDVGIVTNIEYLTKPRHAWYTYSNRDSQMEKYYIVTVYWQNTVHPKTRHEVKLKEKRLKFANRKRKQN